MVSDMFWSVVTRTGQAAVEASTTLLVGFLVAGVMRRMMGPEGVRRLFGGEGWKGLFRAWGVGTLLPVCSLGVIPIAFEMRRSGVRSGTILAFVLAAPHINPLSLLYGLTLSEPLVIVCFAGGSLLIALGAGFFWDRFLAQEKDILPSSVDEPMPAPGLKRLAAVLVTAGKESLGPSMRYVVIAVLFSGLLAGLLPFGCLGTSMRHDDSTSPALMTVIAAPLYSGPLQGMMRLGLMFEHGNSVGAAFALFELGIGINVGLLIWLTTVFGWKRVAAWVGFVIAATLVFAYAVEKPLYFAHEEASHTHAFDEWTSPFVSGGSSARLAAEKLAQKIEVLEPVSIAGLGLLFLIGLASTRMDRDGRLEAWLTKNEGAPAASTSIWSRPLPGPVLGVTVLAGLVVFSVVALYIYYPAPQATFEEISRTRADAWSAVTSGNKDEAIRQIQHFDLLTRKLQVGAVIRTGRMDAEAGKLAEDLRERLEDVRDALLANDVAEAKTKLPAADAAYRLCRHAYFPAPTLEATAGR
jgi:uncharacterized membrane protein YraQ (UPF0718 family)